MEYERHYESFKMITAGGAFIVSKKIHKEIEVLIENLDNNFYKDSKEPFSDYLDRNYKYIKNFKENFNELAKKDLKIK